MRSHGRRLVLLAGALAVAASSTAFMLFDAGLLHSVRCLVDGRDGWLVEYPRGAVTSDEIADVIPPCVSVDVGYVDWNEVGEGELAIVPSGRAWFEYGSSLTLWVEGSAAQATDRCRPAGPSTVPPAGCPDGPQPAP